nr:hypothetical protein [Tanacetum cinerariifolium]
MSSDSHATITYTSMSSYEVIVNGYYGMPMDPLDPYVQLVMEAPPSPDYIPRPEAPPSPNYIPGPEAPPSPDYIPGPKYPEYLPPADDVLLAAEQPLPAAVSPTTEGDDDADDDGDDLSKDDTDDEDEEESSDSEEEEEEHLAPTVPAPALYSFVSASEETKPFEEGETTATPPPFRYRVAARISIQPHILTPFRLKSKVERLLAIPTPPLSPVSPTSYPFPPFLMSLPIFTPLPTLSFPLPSLLPSTSGSESIPEADIPLWERAYFTTPTGGYKVGKSPVATVARQIRPALTIADRRRADDRLIGRLRRERRYFCTFTLVTQMEALQRDVNTLQRQHIEHAQRDVAPEDGDRVAATMAEAEASRVRNGYGSNGSGPRLAQAVRECTYPDFLKCQPLNFKGTEGLIGLTQWFEKMESVLNISNCTAACQVKYAVCTLQGVALTWWNSYVKAVTLEVAQALPWKTLKKMMTDKYCRRGEIKKLKTELWELKTKGTNVIGYSHHFQELALMCDRTFPEESDRVEKYIGGVPDIIHDSMKAAKVKTMQEVIEFATELMDKRIRDAVKNKQKFEGTSGNN